MKNTLKSLFVAAIVMMFCVPATAFAEPHHNHLNGGHHQQYHHGGDHHKRSHHSPPARQCGMSDSQFSNFLYLVSNTTFRSQKMEIIKAAAASNSFTVAQIMSTMRLMTFESDKVDVAVAMYANVCDYNNWYKVYSVFDFDMYARDLKKKLGL